MENKNQERNSPNDKETNQKDLANQNDQRQNTEQELNKKGSTDFDESITENKNEDKKKQLYEEENKGINKKPPEREVEDFDVDESTGGSNFDPDL